MFHVNFQLKDQINICVYVLAIINLKILVLVKLMSTMMELMRRTWIIIRMWNMDVDENEEVGEIDLDEVEEEEEKEDEDDDEEDDVDEDKVNGAS